MSNCDICNVEDISENLIWVTSEDFQPRDGEIVRWQFIELGNVDAVCEQCYSESCLEEL